MSADRRERNRAEELERERARGGSPTDNSPGGESEAQIPSVNDINEEEQTLWKAGSKVQAIKAHRDRTGSGLKECKAKFEEKLGLARTQTDAVQIVRPLCSQCGEPFSARACGPTHATLHAEAEKRIADIKEDELREAVGTLFDMHSASEILEAVAGRLDDLSQNQNDSYKNDALDDCYDDLDYEDIVPILQAPYDITAETLRGLAKGLKESIG